jgi:hypothetical protein
MSIWDIINIRENGVSGNEMWNRKIILQEMIYSEKMAFGKTILYQRS